MKRGYMAWNKELLTPEAMKGRRAKLAELMREKNLSCVVVYGDVSTADELQYLTNLHPYWFHATAIFSRDGCFKFVTGLTNRVNPWICQLTGVTEDRITGASYRILDVAAQTASETAQGGKVGYAGRYTPYALVRKITDTGCEAVCIQDSIDEIMSAQDSGYIETVKEGAEILSKAFGTVIGRHDRSETGLQAAADLEYECRKGRCMDFIIMEAGKPLIFQSPGMSRDKNEPWTFLVYMQYLGQWVAAARNMNPDISDEALEKALAAAASGLKPGSRVGARRDGRIEVRYNTNLRSDYMIWAEGEEFECCDSQIVLLTAEDPESGLFRQDMYAMTPEGGKRLTNI